MKQQLVVLLVALGLTWPTLAQAMLVATPPLPPLNKPAHKHAKQEFDAVASRYVEVGRPDWDFAYRDVPGVSIVFATAPKPSRFAGLCEASVMGVAMNDDYPPVRSWRAFRVVGEPGPLQLMPDGSHVPDPRCAAAGPVLPTPRIDPDHSFFFVEGAPVGAEGDRASMAARVLHQIRNPAAGQPPLVCEKLLARRHKRCASANLNEVIDLSVLTSVSVALCPDGERDVWCIKAELRDTPFSGSSFWTVEARAKFDANLQAFEVISAELDYFAILY